MYYLVHTHYNGDTVHEHKYMTFDEALVDYKSDTFFGQGKDLHRCKKQMYIVDDGLYFEYVGKPYISPVKWDGVDRRKKA